MHGIPANVDGRYRSNEFKKHKDRQRASRMTTIPQLSVPEIFVDDDDDDDGDQTQDIQPQQRPEVPSFGQSTSPDDAGSERSTPTANVPSQDTGYQHPLSYPRSSLSTSHHATSSGFSFELYEPDIQGSGSGEMVRRGSSVSQTSTRGMLDDSVWVESIRRSTTLRRSDRDHYRYGYLG